MKHTKGNWKVVSQMPNGYTIESETGKLICFSQCDDENGEHSDEDMANLDLIKAAPYMLAVLKEAVDHAHVYDTNPALIELFKAVIKEAIN
jgi:hypothetical protein